MKTRHSYFSSIVLLVSLLGATAMACPDCGECFTWNTSTNSCEWDCGSGNCCGVTGSKACCSKSCCLNGTTCCESPTAECCGIADTCCDNACADVCCNPGQVKCAGSCWSGKCCNGTQCSSSDICCGSAGTMCCVSDCCGGTQCCGAITGNPHECCEDTDCYDTVDEKCCGNGDGTICDKAGGECCDESGCVTTCPESECCEDGTCVSSCPSDKCCDDGVCVLECSGDQCCDEGVCRALKECESCTDGVPTDDDDKCTEACETCSNGECVYELEDDESDWREYVNSSGEFPATCGLYNCDGYDGMHEDNCGNELELSCCQEDGTGGVDGCAYRYFYNGSLISSCIWGNSPNNDWYYKNATIAGTADKVFTKLKHVNKSTSMGEGCEGYYCTKIVIYDCIEGKFDSESPIWRRSTTSAPGDIDEGEDGCPGH